MMMRFKKIFMAFLSLVILSVQPVTAMNLSAILQERNRNAATRELFNAIHRRRIEQVRQALAQGADVDLPNVRGYTPLYSAIRLGRDDFIIHLLLKYGANPTARNPNGETPLQEAEMMYGPNTLLYHVLTHAQQEYERKKSRSRVKSLPTAQSDDQGQ